MPLRAYFFHGYIRSLPKLAQFAIIMLIMMIFELVQIILFALDVNFLVPQRTDLKRKFGNDPVVYFYVVCGITMGVCLIGMVDALLLRWQINQKKTGGSMFFFGCYLYIYISRSRTNSFFLGNYYE